jgi:hypothetical protein
VIARRTLLAKLSLALYAAALPARVARAQDARPGRTTGRAFHPVPTGAMIEVSPLDDRPENLGIAAAFRAALARGGYLLGDASAPFRLSFDSEVRPVASGAGTRAPSAPTTGPGNSPGDQAPSPVPEQPMRRTGEAAPRRAAPGLRYVINASLDDRRTGSRVWQGNVRYDDAEGDRAAILARLVPPLMTAFARNERGRSFALE